MRPSALILVAAGLIACQGRAPGAPVPRNALCFQASGMAWPLGDIMHRGAVGHTLLVLSPSPSVLTAHEGQAWATDEVPSLSNGRWKRIGDSLEVGLHDGFTSTTLVLALRGTALSGRAAGTTDELVRQPDGSFTGARHAWVAELRGVTCPARMVA
jgi:hypothetical protein